mgnify:CR=1 FL=1
MKNLALLRALLCSFDHKLDGDLMRVDVRTVACLFGVVIRGKIVVGWAIKVDARGQRRRSRRRL